MSWAKYLRMWNNPNFRRVRLAKRRTKKACRLTVVLRERSEFKRLAREGRVLASVVCDLIEALRLDSGVMHQNLHRYLERKRKKKKAVLQCIISWFLTSLITLLCRITSLYPSSALYWNNWNPESTVWNLEHKIIFLICNSGRFKWLLKLKVSIKSFNSVVRLPDVCILSRFRIKVFRYSCFGTIPHFLNRLLDSLHLVGSTWNLHYLFSGFGLNFSVVYIFWKSIFPWQR